MSSAILEVRQDIIRLLLELEDLVVLREVRSILVAKVALLNQVDDDEAANVESSDLLPDLSSSKYQVEKSNDLELLMKKQDYNPGSPEEWAKYADLYSVISDEDTKAFIEAD